MLPLPQGAPDLHNLIPNPFPSGEGNTGRERGRAFPLPVLRGTKSRILSYYWVQGSPLPKEVCGTHGGFRI